MNAGAAGRFGHTPRNRDDVVAARTAPSLARDSDGRLLRIEGQGGAAFRENACELALELVAPALPAERLHQELHPVARLVLIVAQALEHAHDRLGDVQHLAAGRKSYSR